MLDYKNVGLLHEQFEEQVKRNPHKVAVYDPINGPMTYETLDKVTLSLAKLLQKSGLRENGIVVIYMDKCIPYVVSYIAILRAGGAYLPVDVSYPKPLLNDVLSESEPVVVLTKSELACNLSQTGVSIVCLDDVKFVHQIETLVVDCEAYCKPKLTLESTAFVVYSSGTTGKPKGICQPQRSPILSYLWRHEAYPYEENECEAANIFFVWELFRPLLRGQTLYIIPDDVIYDPKRLLEYLGKHSITRMLFTPSLLETVLDYHKENVDKGFSSMKQIWLCGEVTTTSLIGRAIHMLPGVQFINLYSVSECHDVAAINLTSFYEKNRDKLTTSKFTPVGKLLPSVKVAIFNEEMEIQPVGASGEIYVYGPTLAHGYLKRPDLTIKKFIPLMSPLIDHAAAGDKIYKTGDWGYILSDGSLEICGRCDAMVKVRGYSVELSAIENSLMSLSYIQSCVVLAQGEEGQDKVLVAYLVLSSTELVDSSDKTVSIKQIKGDLKRRLPFYMIPTYFVFLKEIPIVAGSGKLDKKALPAFNKSQYQCQPEYLPETNTEKKLAEIWCSVLQLPSLDIQESFFDLGGHSLLAAKLLQIVNTFFSTDLNVKDLYNFPTLSGMGKLIDRESPEQEPQLDLQQEVDVHCQYDVDLDIQLRAFWRYSSFNKTRWSNACVFLTGSTGYLGAFILWELLNKTESHIFCLIRESSANRSSSSSSATASPRKKGSAGSKGSEKITKRLQNTLQYYQLVNGTESDTEMLINQRVTCVKGDVALTNFGLSEDDYRYLSTEIDYIIHAAAYVNLIYPYSALYSSNVLGTCNVIKFAGISKIKPLHYVSTDAVIPSTMIGSEKDDLQGIWKQLTDGYSQSKWVAEQVVQRASQRGHPIVIYRLGNQAADTVNGSINRDDFNFMMIRSFTKLCCCPNIDWKIEMTPVDFSAKFIIEVAAKQLNTNVGKIFHIINNKPLPLKTLQNWMTVHGFKCDLVSYDDYMQRLKNSDADFISKLYSMLSEVASSSSYFSKLPIHNSKATQETMKSLGMPFPQINNALLTLYFTKLIEQGYITKPRINEHPVQLFEESSLSGKVAIVTGASSGIGEEVAVILAKSGCLVALLARREEKLKQLQQMITSLGGKASYFKTDVSNEVEVENAMASIETILGSVDILVNCAGAMYYQRCEKPDIQICNQMIDVNIKGVMNCTSKVLPSMIERKCGHIVNISSDAGVKGFPGLAVYSGTKFFVEGYSQAIRHELVDHNIRVTCIQPGDVKTPLQDSSLADKDAVEKFYTGSETCQMLEAKDIARTVLFVVSSPAYVALNTVLIEPTGAPI